MPYNFKPQLTYKYASRTAKEIRERYAQPPRADQVIEDTEEARKKIQEAARAAQQVTDEERKKIQEAARASYKPGAKPGVVREIPPSFLRDTQRHLGKKPIPGIDPLGGLVLSGLGGLAGRFGWDAGAQQLGEWAKNPLARHIAGGGTSLLGILLTTALLRRFMGGRR